MAYSLGCGEERCSSFPSASHRCEKYRRDWENVLSAKLWRFHSWLADPVALSLLWRIMGKALDGQKVFLSWPWTERREPMVPSKGPNDGNLQTALPPLRVHNLPKIPGITLYTLCGWGIQNSNYISKKPSEALKVGPNTEHKAQGMATKCLLRGCPLGHSQCRRQDQSYFCQTPYV